MKKRLVVLTLIAATLMAVPAAQAQIPLFTLPVFDVTNYLNALERYYQLQQQLMQLVKSYDQLVLEYKQMLWMAQKLPGLSGYSYTYSPWQNSSAADTYGSTLLWSKAINGAGSAGAGYRQAVDRLLTYGEAYARIPAEQLERVRTAYASVELADAANIHAIQVLGQQRAKSRSAEGAISSLESASLSSSDSLNTEIAVLNKINAAGVMGLRAGQETNQLLVSLLEETVTEAKVKRDAGTRAINIDIACRLFAFDAGMAGVRGTTEAITSFIMP